MVTSNTSFWRFVSLLLTILVIIQWLMLVTLFMPDEKSNLSQYPPQQQQIIPSLPQQHPLSSKSKLVDDFPVAKNYEGVAVTVLKSAPKWFHRRYTVMLHNVLANIPPVWPIQVFYNEKWLEKDVLPLHPGLQYMKINNRRIVWTPIPVDILRRKPKEIMKSEWLWENMIADNVFLFGGNGALCGNSKVPIDAFLNYDYVGAPWMRFNGIGGDGSTHSFRKRSKMLEILKEHPPNDGDQDYHYFLKFMIKDEERYKIADRNITMAFAGINSDHAPLLLSGTQPKLNWTTRDTILAVCPEVKIIFPSLHEPACFGAHPNGNRCKATICALNEIPQQGC